MTVTTCNGACRHDSWYDRFIMPLAVHGACLAPPITRQRRRLIPQAEGVVLEIGLGTGLNLHHYDPAKIKRVIGIDPGISLLHHAERTASTLPFDVEIHVDTAEKMPLDDASVDNVVVTYSFCSIPDATAAVREVRRVLKPGGRFLFSEHGLSDHAATRWWQNRLDPIWTRFAGGCHLNRDIEALLQDEGFSILDIEKRKLHGVPGLLGFNYRGSATPR